MKNTLPVTAAAMLAAAPGFAQGSLHIYNWPDCIAEDTIAGRTLRDASVFLLAFPVTEAIEAGHMAGWLPHLATLY